MAYAVENFKSKKAFKQAVAEGQEVRIFSPGPFPPKDNGVEFISGPHFPQAHSWYAEVKVVEGVVKSVK